MVSPIPEGFTAVTPFLIANDAQKVIDFATKALGAHTVSCLRHNDGTIWNAELEVFGAKVLIAGAHGDQQAFPAFLYLYVEDADSVFKQAIEAGGEPLMQTSDQFFGDRNAGVMDSQGNVWWIATRKENLSKEELERRANEFEKNKQQLNLIFLPHFLNRFNLLYGVPRRDVLRTVPIVADYLNLKVPLNIDLIIWMLLLN